MFHPESNPLAPKSSGPKKPEKDLVKIWLGDAAAAEMDEKPETGDEDLNFDSSLTEKEKQEIKEAKENKIWPRSKYIEWAESFGEDEAWVEWNFVFNKDGTTSVERDLDISSLGISVLPRGWKRVEGRLDLSRNALTSLKGLPEEIGGDLRITFNDLTSLEGLSKTIGGDLRVENNLLVSLKGMPSEFGGSIHLTNNRLTSLSGLPKKIRGSLYVNDNLLTSLEDLSKEIEGSLFLRNNPVESIPAGLAIGGIVLIDASQTALYEDVLRKGYKVR